MIGGTHMNNPDRARQYHSQGFNCAQSVLMASDAYTGLDAETARKVACGFGGGVRCGEICGCITGGVMALGCRGSQSETAALAKEMAERFREEFGFVRCEDLQAKFGGKSNCDHMIGFGAQLTEQIMKEHGFSPDQNL